MEAFNQLVGIISFYCILVTNLYIPPKYSLWVVSVGRNMDANHLLGASIIRIPPHHYIHVLDQNTNIARVELGPLTYIRQDNER